MQIIRIFIIATIIAFVPVLAMPVGVESQQLVAREPSVAEWFRGLGGKIRNAFQSLGKRIRSIGQRKKKAKKVEKSTPTPPPTPPVETRELGVVYAREDADDLYIRGFDDEIFAREFDDDDFEAREFDDDFEAREFDDDFEAREFDDEFEAREFDDELDAREPSRQHPRELSYDALD